MNDSKSERSGVEVARRASLGDLKALYQVFIDNQKWHKDNNIKDIHSLELLSHYVNNSSIMLSEAYFSDFRGLGDLNIRFDQRLTVIIGNNGIGKSSVLDGVSINLSWLKSNILKEDRPGRDVKDNDINNESEYASVTSRYKFSDSYFQIMNTAVKAGSANKRNNDLFEIKSLAGIVRHSNEFNKNLNLPLLVSYDVYRGGDLFRPSKRYSKPKDYWSKLDAYDEQVSIRHDFDGLIDWLKFLITSSRQELKDENFNEILKLEKELDEVKAIISSLPSSFEDVKIKMEDELKLKESQLQEYINQSSGELKIVAINTLNTLTKAFQGFITDLERFDVEFARNKIDLFIIKGGVRLNPYQLSQGEKVLITLFGDISKRIILLNPGLVNPLEGKGIILIDEIELHLHPGWQQIIIESLCATFPNIQFVLTTHSPQVLTTVPKHCIRILKRDPDDELNNRVIAITPSFQTKGVVSADVLSYIMDIDPVPPVTEAQWIDDYIELVETGKSETETAKDLWCSILEHFGKDHPLTLNCINKLNFFNMKTKLMSKKGDAEK